MNEFKLYLRVLLTPVTWVRVRSYEKGKDEFLRRVLRLKIPIEYGWRNHTMEVRIDGTMFWIANMGYGDWPGASRRTVLLMQDRLREVFGPDFQKEVDKDVACTFAALKNRADYLLGKYGTKSSDSEGTW